MLGIVLIRMFSLKISVILMVGTVACDAAKILVLSPGGHSHLQQVYTIGKQLLKSGSHEITALVPEHMKNSPLLNTKEIEVVMFDPGHAATEALSKEENLKIQKMVLKGDPIEMGRKMKILNYEMCISFLRNRELFDRLNAKKFDFAIINGAPMARCYYFMLYRLNVSYATVTTIPSPDMMSSLLNLPSLRAPMTLNAEINDGNNENTFIWRLKNALVTAMIVWMNYDNQFTSFVPERPPMTVTKLASNSKIWLVESDGLLDAPQPIMPHIFHVGGLSITKPKQLESKFKAIADEATDSLVLISFGGYLDFIDEKFYDKIYEALKKLPQFTFIWKMKQHPKEAPPKNVHIFDWLPQREILAHKNVVLFITHCGNAGQYEALYSAVPMLGIPFFSDQASNAIRMYKKGFGRMLHLKTFTTPMLADMIVQMTSNPRYKQAIGKASALYRLKKPAIERAAEAIEHVLEHGSDHLRSPAVELEWYQLLMWDVALFLLIAMHALIFSIGFCFCKCYKCCRRKCSQTRKQEIKPKSQ
ncbi:UDP-glucuronosyltransferase 2C1-like [Tubulanus polymorphus]|uniref:UDP-glucuronosyltransferase 2C1-like n=1 Tax=Tubulanus polymorphus TaxID=672921 RepID=UPI003DA2E6F4